MITRPRDLVKYTFDSSVNKQKKATGNRGLELRKTDSLVDLFSLAKGAGVTVPADVSEAGRLTRFAAGTRYPGLEDVTEQEYRRALELAERVVTRAEETIARTESP